MLVIFGVLVIGGIIFSMIYIGHIRNNVDDDKTAQAQDSTFSDFNSTLYEYDNPNKVCNANSVCEPQKGETTENCLTDCGIVPPISDKPSGAYLLNTEISLSTPSLGATIYYTIDGTQPNPQSTQYTSEIVLSSNINLKAIACKSSCSEVSEYVYTISSVSFSVMPDSGNYLYGSQLITTQSAEQGTQIRYTIDGSEPTQESTLYTNPISLTTPHTFKAKAFKENYLPSETITKEYKIILLPPTVLPTSGTYNFNTQIKLNTSISGSEIKYTLDGKDPYIYGEKYSGPFIKNQNFILKAVTTHPDSKYIVSNVIEQNYIFSNPDSTLSFYPDKTIPKYNFDIIYKTSKNLGTKTEFEIKSLDNLGECTFNNRYEMRIVNGLYVYTFINNRCNKEADLRIILNAGLQILQFAPIAEQVVSDYIENDYNITYNTLAFRPIKGNIDNKFLISYYINKEDYEKFNFLLSTTSDCILNNSYAIETYGEYVILNYENNRCTSVGNKDITLNIKDNKGNIISVINSKYLVEGVVK